MGTPFGPCQVKGECPIRVDDVERCAGGKGWPPAATVPVAACHDVPVAHTLPRLVGTFGMDRVKVQRSHLVKHFVDDGANTA